MGLHVVRLLLLGGQVGGHDFWKDGKDGFVGTAKGPINASKGCRASSTFLI